MRINKNSQSGFTLVEMMVIAGVISVLAVGFSAYMYQQTKQLNSSSSRDNINQLQANMLGASGKVDSLVQSEGVQKASLATLAPVTGCVSPCSSGYDESNKWACIYDCRIPALHGQCSVLEAPCKYIYLTQCTCSATTGGRDGGSDGGASNSIALPQGTTTGSQDIAP